jgi:hypothetical protein
VGSAEAQARPEQCAQPRVVTRTLVNEARLQRPEVATTEVLENAQADRVIELVGLGRLRAPGEAYAPAEATAALLGPVDLEGDAAGLNGVEPATEGAQRALHCLAVAGDEGGGAERGEQPLVLSELESEIGALEHLGGTFEQIDGRHEGDPGVGIVEGVGPEAELRQQRAVVAAEAVHHSTEAAQHADARRRTVRSRGIRDTSRRREPPFVAACS